jgi:hypothetical protein
MYKIIGADQKEYGPISAEQIRQWISEGRVNGQTMVCAEGSTDWKPLEMFPEFGLMASPVAAGIASPTLAPPASPEEILARDYTLDIGSCIGRGWTLLKDNFGTLVVIALLLLVMQFGVGFMIGLAFNAAGINEMPASTQQYLSPIYAIFGAIVMGPVLGGAYQVILALIRGQPVGAGDIFRGFNSFQDLFLGKLIPTLAYTICMLPYSIANATRMGPFLDGLKHHPPNGNPMEIFSQILSVFMSTLPIFLICMIPTTYLSVNWQFTLALIADKKIGFWKAMCTSWKMVHKHWFSVFGLLILVGLINIAGVCLCCVGLLVTVPLWLAAVMYAYEDIFSRKTA